MTATSMSESEMEKRRTRNCNGGRVKMLQTQEEHYLESNPTNWSKPTLPPVHTTAMRQMPWPNRERCNGKQMNHENYKNNNTTNDDHNDDDDHNNKTKNKNNKDNNDHDDLHRIQQRRQSETRTGFYQ